MKLLLIALLLTSPCLAAKKQRDWQAGKVLDTDRERVYLGSRENTTGTVNAHETYGAVRSTGTSRAVYGSRETTVIESGEYVYVVGRLLKWRWNKYARLVVNEEVKFAIEKDNVYLLDADGREHKGKLVKQIKRE